MEDGEWKDDLQGTPQGAVVSPILANVYLHYVLDLWFQKKWRARKATGDIIKRERSYLTLYNRECEETRWSLA